MKVSRTELTPVDFLRRAAYVYGPKVGLVHADDGRRYTWAEIADRSWRLANALRGLGLAKDDRVAVLSPNAPMILEAHFAVPAAGLQLVAINTRLASDEIGYILRHSGARVLLVDHELVALVAPGDVADLVVVRCDDTGADGCPYEAFLAASAPDDPESWLADEEEPISINYTSGTTGRPKGVQYTHRGAYLNALSEVRRGRALARVGVPLDAADVPLQRLVLPVGGDGGRRHPRDDAQGRSRRGVATDRRRGRDALLRRADRAARRSSTTRRAHRVEPAVTALVAAAPPSPTLFARMAELNFRAVHVYGLTETYGPITVAHVAARLGRRAAGRAGAAARPAGPGLPDGRPGARGRRRR